MSYKRLKESFLSRPATREGYDTQRGLNRLGRIFKESRRSANLPQQELARVAGIAQADISRLEAGLGERGPTFDTLIRLAHAQKMKLVVELVPEEETADRPRLREAF